MPSSREVDEHTIKLAIDAFKDHHLVLDDRKRGHWRIARKYDDGTLRSDMAAEIISLWGGRLFVGGDIDDCVFAYSGGREENEAFHLRKLAWVGRCKDVSYYVKQKASIGLTDGGKLTEEWDPDVARHQLQEGLKKEYLSEWDKEAFEGALKRIEDGRPWAETYLAERMEDPCDFLPHFGMVTSPRVIYAWAACRKLCELILDESEDNV